MPQFSSLLVTAAATYYQEEQRSKRAKEAQESADKFRARELEILERQAGEYTELTVQQMELQSQASQIKTLANLIGEGRQPAEPRVYTLPRAKEYSAADRINQAIGDWLRG